MLSVDAGERFENKPLVTLIGDDTVKDKPSKVWCKLSYPKKVKQEIFVKSEKHTYFQAFEHFCCFQNSLKMTQGKLNL